MRFEKVLSAILLLSSFEMALASNPMDEVTQQGEMHFNVSKYKIVDHPTEQQLENDFCPLYNRYRQANSMKFLHRNIPGGDYDGNKILDLVKNDSNYLLLLAYDEINNECAGFTVAKLEKPGYEDDTRFYKPLTIKSMYVKKLYEEDQDIRNLSAEALIQKKLKDYQVSKTLDDVF